MYKTFLNENQPDKIPEGLALEESEFVNFNKELVLLYVTTHLEFIIAYQFYLYQEFDITLNKNWRQLVLNNKKEIGAILLNSETTSEQKEKFHQAINSLKLIAKFYKCNYEDSLSENNIEGLDCLLFRSVVDHIITAVDIMLYEYQNDLT